jgi:DNA-binding CsgD family transcriptional regulator
VPVQEVLGKIQVAGGHRGASHHRIENAGQSLPDFAEVADRRLRMLCCLLDQVAEQLRNLRSECTAQCVLAGEALASDLPGSTRAKLTPQEARIVQLAMRGYDNRVIAEHLHLSVNTIKSHLRHALRKLELRSRHQLGWINPSTEDHRAASLASEGADRVPGAAAGLVLDSTRSVGQLRAEGASSPCWPVTDGASPFG